MTAEDVEIKEGWGGSATCEATSGRLLRSMSLGAGQKRTSGDTPAPGESDSPEVNCQKCRGTERVGEEKVRGYLKLK